MMMIFSEIVEKFSLQVLCIIQGKSKKVSRKMFMKGLTVKLKANS